VQLSKTDYTTYLKHPAWLWLRKHDKQKLPPIDPALQAIFDTGHEFEQYAETQFPDGITIGFDSYNQYRTLPARTTAALESGAKTIFQGRFEAERLTFICDVIQVVGQDEVDLFEIKSSTSAKPEHIVDLAFQMVVLEKCGFKVRNIAVIHVDNQYVRNGKVDPAGITATTDVTESVKTKRDFTLEKIDEALKVMALNECPDKSLLLADSSHFKEWLEIYKYIEEPKDNSIYDLCRLDADTLDKLQSRDIKMIKDIPADLSLKSKQRLQVDALQQGHPSVDKKEIQDFLDSFTFPLYFLDYETMSSLVPYFDGLRPYQQLPFQYSLHILDAPDAEVRHVEYLHRSNSNPAQPLTEALMSHIGDTGTVVTWNMSFEKTCNTLLGELVPEHADFYTDLNDRIVDLMTPFSKSWYVDSGFKGSASIKKVLPVLVPELSHKILEISDGSTAQRLWMKTILDSVH